MRSLLFFLTTIVSIETAAQYRSVNEYTTTGPLKVAMEYVVEDKAPFVFDEHAPAFVKDSYTKAINSKRYYYARLDSYAGTSVLSVTYSPYFVITYSYVKGFSNILSQTFFWMVDISDIPWLHKTKSKKRFNFPSITPPNEPWYVWAFDIQETKVNIIYQGKDEMERFHAIESYLGK